MDMSPSEYLSLADVKNHQVGRPLRFDLVGKHSARRGDFRVIYEVDDDSHRGAVVAVDHRSDVYRPR
jgi:mRNA-degrading endonuclease RelE of RelBE toxin-antitoxin system